MLTAYAAICKGYCPRFVSPLPPDPSHVLVQRREFAGGVEVGTHQIECAVECGDKFERFERDRAVLVAIVPSRSRMIGQVTLTVR